MMYYGSRYNEAKASRIHKPFYRDYSKRSPHLNKTNEQYFHTIQLPNRITAGLDVSDFRFSHIKGLLPDLKGKSVLDVAAWDGYFSFKAETLGAARVVAVDYFCWNGPGWGNKLGFDHARKLLNSKVECIEIDVPDICPEAVGRFDVVFLFGVLYHLPSILTSFVGIAECAKETLVIETLEDRTIPQEFPLMRFYPFDECHQDFTNWFVPNPAAITAMCNCAGFNVIAQHHYTVGAEYPRGVYRATRSSS